MKFRAAAFALSEILGCSFRLERNFRLQLSPGANFSGRSFRLERNFGQQLSPGVKFRAATFAWAGATFRAADFALSESDCHFWQDAEKLQQTWPMLREQMPGVFLIYRCGTLNSVDNFRD